MIKRMIKQVRLRRFRRRHVEPVLAVSTQIGSRDHCQAGSALEGGIAIAQHIVGP
jgi:hypothetical protein